MVITTTMASSRRLDALVRHMTAASSDIRRTFTAAELKCFDGADGAPVYVAVKGSVFDVSASRAMYGPGGGYEFLGGKDASRALGKMSLDPADVKGDPVRIDDLSGHELDTLDDWFFKFKKKYPLVGLLA